MATFGIVGEGITDQIVLENILVGFFDGHDDEPDIRYLQPPLDETGRQGQPAHAGWGLVFKFFEAGRHLESLAFVDYLVVQIDTDVSEQKGFDVPWRDGGRELTPDELVERVVRRFATLIGEDVFRAHEHRLLFAISVHQLECWLLPLLETKAALRAKTSNCLDVANKARRRANLEPLRKGDSKLPASYREASQPFRKRKVLLERSRENPSLRLFVDTLTARRIRPD